jgi:hypothetical protein
MINVLKELWPLRRSPKVFLEIALDHVEIGQDFLILGLELAWLNTTPEPMHAEEIQVLLYPKHRRGQEVHFYFHGHFSRIPLQRTIQKLSGSRQFVIPSEEPHVERLRFMTRAILDLPPGEYPMQIETKVNGGTLLHDDILTVVPRSRYRTTEGWE